MKKLNLKNKKVYLIGGIGLITIILVTTITLLVVKHNNQSISATNDNTNVEEAIEPLEQEIILDLDTTGYNEAEEVAIIIEDENNITIIPKDDPEYDSKTQNKTVELGSISEGKVKLTTKNEVLINISKLTREEQIAKIKVTPKTTTEETEVAEEQSTEATTETAQATNNNNSGVTSTTTTKSTSVNGGATKSSSSSSSKSSGSNSGSSSSSSKSSGTTKGATPTGTFHYYHNASLENQIVSALNTKFQTTMSGSKTMAEWGDKAVNGSGPSGNGFTYRSLQQCQNVANGGGIYKVYVTDEYCVYSDGSETKTGNSLVYIYH